LGFDHISRLDQISGFSDVATDSDVTGANQSGHAGAGDGGQVGGNDSIKSVPGF